MDILYDMGVSKLLAKVNYYFKGLVHPKMKILSLITHPHVVPDLHSPSEHK